MSKFTKMARYIPGLYKPTTNPSVRGLLGAWAAEDDLIVQAARDAKDQIFVKLAQSSFLDALGSNVGVFRPTQFNLSDDKYRQLIPALSFFPKQVKRTIQAVLDIFFDPGNPGVQIAEINPNEIVIQIPSSVPSLRRTLLGSHHFHAYNATIVSVDNIFKTMVIDLIDPDKQLIVDELANGTFGQAQDSALVASNTAGNSGVTLQFFAATDLSVFDFSPKQQNSNIALPNYPGSFLADPTAAFNVTAQRGVLGQTITAGNIIPALSMSDASGIPNQSGFLVFNSYRDNEEALVRYFGRPNNSTLLIDPTYMFAKNHSSGDVVNFIVTPHQDPATNGQDYSIYLVGVTAAREVAQAIIESIVAAGVVIRWIILEPECD